MQAGRMVRLTVLSILSAGVPGGTALAAQSLVPHRAVYDLKLGESSERAGITGIEGRMVYEFAGSPCDGYTVKFRFVTRIDTSEDSRLTDQQTATFENGEGTVFSFTTKSFVNDSLDSEVRGTATRGSGKTVVELKKPSEKEIELEQTLFPTQHMVDLIKRANDGETFYETTLFDGSDDANEAMITTVVIGKKAEGGGSSEDVAAMGALKKESYWPVSIAYFDPESAEGGEELPAYRIGFKLYENGISRDLVMDYGDFSMNGHLVDLSLLEPGGACGQ